MYKIYYQGDQDDLLAQCSGILSQFVRTDGLYKQAASSCFPASVISENKPDDDHFMMHLVAMGSWPRYMPNRNGDAFTRESLLNTHDTFVKFAKLYREHAHHDPEKNLGFVKASAYNEDLDRVELLVHGNKRKAEEAYETAKKGGELSFSMAGKMAFDQCSCCGQKSKNQASYCTHLKNHMNQYVPEFRKYAFAFNPDPKFFDISLVRRPADRIAHYLEYVFGEDKDSLTKAASDRDNGKLVISGAEWAKYAGYSDDRVSYPEDFSTMVEYLADKERWVSEVDGSSALNPAVRFVNDVIKKAQVKANTELPSGLASLLPATLFHKLASNGVIIPFDMFCAYIEDKSLDEVRKDPEFIKASSELPYMFRALQKTAPNEELVKIANSFRPQDEWVVNSLLFDNGLVQNEIVKLANDFSSDLSGIQGRALYSIKKSSWNEGTPTDSLSALPYAYACYQTHMLMHSKALDISSLYAIGGNRFAAEKS